MRIRNLYKSSTKKDPSSLSFKQLKIHTQKNSKTGFKNNKLAKDFYNKQFTSDVALSPVQLSSANSKADKFASSRKSLSKNKGTGLSTGEAGK
jgi:hypothetical protein